jgi:hypothetical protein
LQTSRGSSSRSPGLQRLVALVNVNRHTVQLLQVGQPLQHLQDTEGQQQQQQQQQEMS